MLQQTQVDRVVPRYEAFLGQFPNFEVLAAAPTAEVIRAWRGLGYNRRAVRLQRLAQVVCERYAGKLPEAIDGMTALEGVGRYTAAAVACFAFGARCPSWTQMYGAYWEESRSVRMARVDVRWPINGRWPAWRCRMPMLMNGTRRSWTSAPPSAWRARQNALCVPPLPGAALPAMSNRCCASAQPGTLPPPPRRLPAHRDTIAAG